MHCCTVYKFSYPLFALQQCSITWIWATGALLSVTALPQRVLLHTHLSGHVFQSKKRQDVAHVRHLHHKQQRPGVLICLLCRAKTFVSDMAELLEDAAGYVPTIQ